MTQKKHAKIKKYPNRRLYDTESSKYVTLKQVGDMIKSGVTVEVTDVTTEEDVTSFILNQILLEEAKNKNILLPSPLLHLIIQYGDNILSEFFEKYLQKTVEAYVTQKSIFDEQFKRILDFGFDVSEMAQKNIEDLNQFKSFFKFFDPDGKTGK